MWEQLNLLSPLEVLCGSVLDEPTSNCPLSLSLYFSLSLHCVRSDPLTENKTSDLSSKQTSFCSKLSAKFHLTLFAFTDLTQIFLFFSFFSFRTAEWINVSSSRPAADLIWNQCKPDDQLPFWYIIWFNKTNGREELKASAAAGVTKSTQNFHDYSTNKIRLSVIKDPVIKTLWCNEKRLEKENPVKWFTFLNIKLSHCSCT